MLHRNSPPFLAPSRLHFPVQASVARAKQLADAEAEAKRIAAQLGVAVFVSGEGRCVGGCQRGMVPIELWNLSNQSKQTIKTC